MSLDDKPPLLSFISSSSQLGFSGVSATGKSCVKREIRKVLDAVSSDLGAFTRILGQYLFLKLFSFVKRIILVTVGFVRFKDLIRAYTIRKLLWRRGALFRPAAHVAVLSLAVTVVLLGGIFPGSNVILGQGVAQDPDQVVSTPDVLSEVVTPETEVSEDSPREDLIEYTVQAGDTLTSIGEKFKISIDTIRYANNLSNIHQLKPGQTLTILPVSGLVHKVKEGDTVENLAKKYAVSPQFIIDFNYMEEPFELTVGTELTIPNAQIPEPPKPKPTTPYADALAPVPFDVASLGSGEFVWPTDTRYITQYFRSYHPAIDIAKESPIYAADSGVVLEAVSSGWNYGYGNYIRIDHGNGYSTLYAHLAELYVSAGEEVSKGQTIGYMGCTGRCWGTHVHFVVQYNGQYINPLSVF